MNAQLLLIKKELTMPEFWYGENDIEKYEVTFSTDAFYLDATARDAVMIHVETDFST